MKRGSTIGVGVAAAAALMTLAAVPASDSPGDKCAKCMDYNHCNWYDPPTGLYEDCDQNPCEYVGDKCAEFETLATATEKREMRLPGGGFVRLVEITPGLFASYSCGKEVVAMAVEDAAGAMRLIDGTPAEVGLAEDYLAGLAVE
jgi:hypothetical protein